MISVIAIIQIMTQHLERDIQECLMKRSNRIKRKKVEKIDRNNYLSSIPTIDKSLSRVEETCTRSLRIGTCHSCGRPCFSPWRKGGSLHLQAKDNQPRPRDIKDPVPASRATIYLPALPLSSFLANSPPSLSPRVPILLGRVHDDTRLRH